MPLLFSQCNNCQEPFPNLHAAFIEMNGMRYHLGDFCSAECMNENIQSRIRMEIP